MFSTDRPIDNDSLPADVRTAGARLMPFHQSQVMNNVVSIVSISNYG
jgi:hypothetical protein